MLYISLDSLPDPAVASAIGAIFLADLAALAGIRYNLGGDRRISLFVDEISNVINQPLIEILNKGAEGGIYTTCAMQTLAEKMWSGPPTYLTYEQFQQLASVIGEAPGTHLPQIA